MSKSTNSKNTLANLVAEDMAAKAADIKAQKEFMATHKAVTLFAHDTGGGKVGYKNLKGQAVMAAYTLAGFESLGMATRKGKAVNKGSKARSRSDIAMLLGTRAPGYWLGKGWLAQGKGGITLTAQGLNVLTQRLEGKARPAYNTTVAAVNAVKDIMRKGGENDIGYTPIKVKI